VRSRRRANGGRFWDNQFGGADGLDGHGARLCVSIKDELNLGPLQDSVHDILGPFGAENDGSATSKPDGVSGSDIINLEAMTLDQQNVMGWDREKTDPMCRPTGPSDRSSFWICLASSLTRAQRAA